jgi:hypothetical protein
MLTMKCTAVTIYGTVGTPRIDVTHNITHYKEMLLFTIMARDNWGHGKRHNYYF